MVEGQSISPSPVVADYAVGDDAGEVAEEMALVHAACCDVRLYDDAADVLAALLSAAAVEVVVVSNLVVARSREY